MPTLILSGGPFDGRVVESKDVLETVPDSLGFTQAGECKFITGDASTGKISMFDRWLIQPPIGDTVKFPAHVTLAHYHRVGQVDDAGRLLFAYRPPAVVILALKDLLDGTKATTRSQAKRVLKNGAEVKQILNDVATPVRLTLDFAGIESVDHSFVDEAFRVWENEHPDSLLTYVNADERTEAMIRGVRKKRAATD